ncbi:septal ring lytic transglycosylase RlpA family protein [Actinomadura scrupuli]|uniref:septal ring lytic transglycosylase RlpA family protein n=1 Tax=Actinomadura scrupuli TaxID=559629 RepID=UPI003D96D304
MGSSPKHGSRTGNPRLRGIVMASTLALAVITTTAWALVSTGGPKARSTAAGAELTGRTPGRAARDGLRTPLADPSAATGAASMAPEPVRKRVRPVRKAAPRARFRVLSSGVCQASYYGGSQATASGEPFDSHALTAAHKTLPMDSRVRVTNEGTGRSVIVRINDRGPYVGGRCLDLSTAAMKAVGGVGSGVITAKYQVLARA